MNATYTVKQVAEILGYSTNSIYTFLKEKRIKGVRVGRGRFRIPQAEVDRLLNIKRSGKADALGDASIAAQGTRPIEGPLSTPNILSSDDPIVIHEPHSTFHIMVPSLFDWFVSIISIVYGCSLFLYSRVYAQYAIEPFIPWLVPLRVSLIVGALGLLYASMRGRKESLWHKVFLSILGISFVVSTSIFFKAGEYDGIVIYGGLAIVIFAHVLINLRSILSFTIYVATISVGLPLSFVASPRWAQLKEGWPSILTNPVLGGVGMALAVLVYIIVLIWAFRKHRMIFWCFLTVNAVIFILVALTSAGQLLWGRTFIFLIIALTMLFVPFWESLQFTQRRDRMEIFVLFGLILGLFLTAIFVVGSVQNIVLDYTSKQMESKVGYGRLLVETTIENAQTTVEHLAQNPSLLDALAKSDVPAMTGIMRGFFEGGTQIRRFVIVSTVGEPLAVYPYDMNIEGQNFAERDYLKEVLQNKKMYITDVFIGVTHVPTILFVAPIFSADGNIAGVVLGALDLDKLGDRLQRIANAGSMEYFVIADRAGNRIVHPNLQLVNTPLEVNSGIRKGMLGYRGSGLFHEDDGQQILQAYDSISVTSWGIGVSVPVISLLESTKSGIIVIISVALLSTVLVVGYIIYRRPRVVIPIDSS